MKKLFIASAIALASLTGSVLPSNAETVIIRDGGPNYHHRNYDHRGWDHRRHDSDCFTKRVVRWHHGEKVVTVNRVCR